MSIYEIRVQERLDAHWAAWFEGLTLAYDGDTTVLRGSLVDEAALHGVLSKVAGLNLHLLSVNAVETDVTAWATFVTPATPDTSPTLGREPEPRDAPPSEPLADTTVQKAPKRKARPLCDHHRILTITLRHGLASPSEVIPMSYSVGQVAKIARVTVRTLHHYDEIGLLHPSGRLDSGYRSYSMADLERLQRILCYRQLGFPLDHIKAVLDDTEADALEHLRRQHALLSERIKALQRMAATVETLTEAHTMGITLEPHELLEVFGESDPTAYREEAEQQWGNSYAWAESQRRASTYTKDDWRRMQAEFATLMADIAVAKRDGLAPGSHRAMDLAEQHRAYLERWFYPCSYAMHRGLGDLYVNDPRFAAQLAKYAPEDAGFVGYLRDAISANAERHTTARQRAG